MRTQLLIPALRTDLSILLVLLYMFECASRDSIYHKHEIRGFQSGLLYQLYLVQSVDLTYITSLYYNMHMQLLESVLRMNLSILLLL